jgi:hypothetical protein
LKAKQGSTAFFEKKAAKKLLLNRPQAVKPPGPKLTKVFWFFFSKKNALLASARGAA